MDKGYDFAQGMFLAGYDIISGIYLVVFGSAFLYVVIKHLWGKYKRED